MTTVLTWEIMLAVSIAFAFILVAVISYIHARADDEEEDGNDKPRSVEEEPADSHRRRKQG